MLRTLISVWIGCVDAHPALLPGFQSRLNIAFSGTYLLTSVLPAVEPACIAG
jgi:hypothetical protein